MKRIKKADKDKFMERIRKASSEEYETEWDEKGVARSKAKSEIKKGKKSNAKGSEFERKVRKDLGSKGRIVDKWGNNVNLEEDRLVVSKKVFNPFKKIMVPGSGFPDFISIQHVHGELYSVIGVEVKTNGILSKIEKEKCVWYLKNKIFSQIWIAKKGEKRGSIEYIDFSEKY